MAKTQNEKRPTNPLTAHIDSASESAQRCIALIEALHQYSEAINRRETPKGVESLLDMIRGEFKVIESEMEAYWSIEDKPSGSTELYGNAEDALYEFSTYITIFENTNWSEVGQGGINVAIRIFSMLGNNILGSIIELGVSAYRLREVTPNFTEAA